MSAECLWPHPSLLKTQKFHGSSSQSSIYRLTLLLRSGYHHEQHTVFTLKPRNTEMRENTSLRLVGLRPTFFLIYNPRFLETSQVSDQSSHLSGKLSFHISMSVCVRRGPPPPVLHEPVCLGMGQQATQRQHLALHSSFVKG